jgi:hypothetical protein
MKKKPIKQIVCIFSLILLFAPANAQNLPSWAEPSEDSSFGTTRAERQTPDRSQRERSSGLSGDYTPGPVTWNNGKGKGSKNACNGIINGNGNSQKCAEYCENNPSDIKCRQACAIDPNICSTPIPIDNPFALGFLTACGLAYAYIKL